MTSSLALIARRTIRAKLERVFAAWTEPEQLRAWWGPRPVTCSDAVVDLRVGGCYRIANALPDGRTLTIYGEFRTVEPPRKLVYTWQMDDGRSECSLVTVTFTPRADGTEVVVVHENVPTEAMRESHERGWRGCLDALESHSA
ncbi:MAG TPA: SRPBCC domain-containing protein [Polyangiaceae bacterium]|nr:SRPBCC domain-containing protein [Polyangiaceae bacterium]